MLKQFFGRFDLKIGFLGTCYSHPALLGLKKCLRKKVINLSSFFLISTHCAREWYHGNEIHLAFFIIITF
jgi:hypothetical protein